MNNNYNCVKCGKVVAVSESLKIEQQPHILFGVGAECFREFALEFKGKKQGMEAGPFCRDESFQKVLQKMISDTYQNKNDGFDEMNQILNKANANMAIISSFNIGKVRESALAQYLDLAKAELEDMGLDEKEIKFFSEKYDQIYDFNLKNKMTEAERRAFAIEILEDALGVQFFEENLNKLGDYRDDFDFFGKKEGFEPNYTLAQNVIGLDPNGFAESILTNGFLDSARDAAEAFLPNAPFPINAIKKNYSADIQKNILAEFGYGLDFKGKNIGTMALIHSQITPLIRKSDNSLSMFLESQSKLESASPKDREIYKRAAEKFDDVCKEFNSKNPKLRLSWDMHILGTKSLNLAVKGGGLIKSFGADSMAPSAFFPIIKGAFANGDADALLLRVTDDKIKLEFRKRNGTKSLQEFEKIAAEKNIKFENLAADERLFMLSIGPNGSGQIFSATFEEVTPEVRKIRDIKKVNRVNGKDYTTVVTRTFNDRLFLNATDIKQPGDNSNVVGNLYDAYSPYRKESTGAACLFPAPNIEELRALKKDFLKKNPDPESMYHLVARKMDEILDMSKVDPKKASNQ